MGIYFLQNTEQKIHIPFIISYFLTGIIVGPFGLHLITEEQASIPAELGGGLQMIITTFLVWAALQHAGFAANTALFLGGWSRPRQRQSG
jgi:CPA2 family monovalent cation:H+ antiporter-2